MKSSFQKEVSLLHEEQGSLAQHCGRAWQMGDDLNRGMFKMDQVQDGPSFLSFIEEYVSKVLHPCELPAILSAAFSAQEQGMQGLIEADQWLQEQQAMMPLARASRYLASRQLNRLRSLHDVRLLNRYRDALARSQVHGWHVLVYGVVLHTFSLPLRQGLAHYQQAVLHGFKRSAASALGWEESLIRQLTSRLDALPFPSLEELRLKGDIATLGFRVL